MGEIHLWDVSKKRHLGEWRAHDAGLSLLGFSADRSTLASACVDIGINDNPGHSEVKIWDLSSRK
jgi:hypothetical protein